MAPLSEVEIVTARLDPPPEAVRALSLRLCGEEQARAARLRFDRDRRRFVVARARLRELLGERLGSAPESIALEYGANGKPALAGRFAASGWRFNLSRREELAVYAFSRASEVGVDVEAIGPVREAEAIAARLFSARERKTYLALAPHERALGFLRVWTRKEALAKALGDGLTMPAEALDCLRAARAGWRLQSFSPQPGFIAAAAHRG
jgi:4'-phosphopantetheinyl transferase